MTLFEYAVIVKPTDPYAEPRLLNDDTIGVTFAANAEAARTKALLIHASEVDEDDRGRVEVIIRPFVEPQRLY